MYSVIARVGIATRLAGRYFDPRITFVNNMRYFDAHTHLNFVAYEVDREEVVVCIRGQVSTQSTIACHLAYFVSIGTI